MENKDIKLEKYEKVTDILKEGNSEVIGVSYQVISTGETEKALPVLHSFGETEENGVKQEILIHPKREEAEKLAEKVGRSVPGAISRCLCSGFSLNMRVTVTTWRRT